MTGMDGEGGPRWLAASAAAASLPAPGVLQSVMKPLPTPLFVSGVSERTLKQFAPQLSALGLEVMQAPSGSSPHSFDNDLKPGSAVSGVLMSGDFQFAGTGTVTWRHGNRILAFGHPFLQSGPTGMPMASAEILTVVQSYARSFKLPVIGPVVGSIYQDRLVAIAGEIGPEGFDDAPGSAFGRARRQEPVLSGRDVPEPDALADSYGDFAAGIHFFDPRSGGAADDLHGVNDGDRGARPGQPCRRSRG